MILRLINPSFRTTAPAFPPGRRPAVVLVARSSLALFLIAAVVSESAVGQFKVQHIVLAAESVFPDQHTDFGG